VGRLIRYIIVALILWAAWHVGMAQWRQFQFQDAVSEVAQFGVDRDENAVRDAVTSAAARLGVPLAPERLAIRREADHLYIDIQYTVPLELLPRYRYPWTFTVSAHGWFVPGGRVQTPAR
jgi:hypothetical protein